MNLFIEYTKSLCVTNFPTFFPFFFSFLIVFFFFMPFHILLHANTVLGIYVLRLAVARNVHIYTHIFEQQRTRKNNWMTILHRIQR